MGLSRLRRNLARLTRGPKNDPAVRGNLDTPPDGRSSSSAEGLSIFISYRRADQAYAGRLYDGLAQRLGEQRVFLEVELEAGTGLAESIRRAFESFAIVLAVI